MPSNTTEPETPEPSLYRALQTLKDQDGNYVLSTISFSSQYGMQRLIEFIEENYVYKAKYEKDLREIIGEYEADLPENAQNRWTYPKIRNRQRSEAIERAKALGYNLTEDKDE